MCSVFLLLPFLEVWKVTNPKRAFRVATKHGTPPGPLSWCFWSTSLSTQVGGWRSFHGWWACGVSGWWEALKHALEPGKCSYEPGSNYTKTNIVGRGSNMTFVHARNTVKRWGGPQKTITFKCIIFMMEHPGQSWLQRSQAWKTPSHILCLAVFTSKEVEKAISLNHPLPLKFSLFNQLCCCCCCWMEVCVCYLPIIRPLFGYFSPQAPRSVFGGEVAQISHPSAGFRMIEVYTPNDILA